MSTPVPKPQDIAEQWYLIDADGQVLGRLATQIATLLRGKHQPTFTPHIPTNNHVVVINAAKVAVTGDKADSKQYYRYGRQPGSLRARTLAETLERFPQRPLELAVRRMLPDNKLRRVWLNHLHVYAGPEHPHTAQQPAEVSRG